MHAYSLPVHPSSVNKETRFPLPPHCRNADTYLYTLLLYILAHQFAVKLRHNRLPAVVARARLRPARCFRSPQKHLGRPRRGKLQRFYRYRLPPPPRPVRPAEPPLPHQLQQLDLARRDGVVACGAPPTTITAINNTAINNTATTTSAAAAATTAAIGRVIAAAAAAAAINGDDATGSTSVGLCQEAATRAPGQAHPFAARAVASRGGVATTTRATSATDVTVAVAAAWFAHG